MDKQDDVRGGSDKSEAEIVADLFGPAIVLPEQVMAGARRDSYVSGEKALMLAVLEDGIRCFQEHLTQTRSNPRLLAKQAEDWIRDEDWSWPFSFVNVCEDLGINPEALRVSLLAWKARNISNEANRTDKPKAKILSLHLRVKRHPFRMRTSH